MEATPHSDVVQHVLDYRIHFFGHYIGTQGMATHGYEPAIFGLPQYLIDELSGKATILPGNAYVFLSSPRGLEKDIELGRIYKNVESYLKYCDVVLILNPPH